MKCCGSFHHPCILSYYEYTLLWQCTTTSYKTIKTNADFCLNFYAGEIHTKFRGVQQI